MPMNERLMGLYGSGAEHAETGHEIFPIIEVDSNRVSEDALAETDFSERLIRKPTFRKAKEALMKKYSHVSGFVGNIVDNISEYLLGHEFREAENGRPLEGLEHSLVEKDYLETLREEGRWMAYFAGIAMHKLRLDNGDNTGFSGRIAGYINSKIRKHAEELRFIEPVVEEALSPEYV